MLRVSNARIIYKVIMRHAGNEKPAVVDLLSSYLYATSQDS